MISKRTVVVRREGREVGTAASAAKVLGRLQELLRLYQRVCVVLEDEVMKEGRKTWWVKSSVRISDSL